MNDLAEAQAGVRRSYRSASVGQLYSGAVWLASALAWSMLGTTAGVLGCGSPGLAIALRAREASVIGAWLIGLALLGVGVWAEGRHRSEFASGG